jgi:17beta-estradiol 17-dehydrogenase / very-long-chain 3-oxoacyl-CoA reductase
LKLAKRGMNIILVSRSLTKLQIVAKEIEETFNVETAVIDVDFTSGPEIYDKIKQHVEGKEIGVLVNNVGMSYPFPVYFLSIPDREKFIKDTINCNVTSVSMMCSIILPQMVQRKRGIIINISSIAAVISAPQFTVYSASKAFVNKLSEDLLAEYKHQGIIIQSVLPGPVATNMTKLLKEYFIGPTAKDFVESAFKTVGFAESTTGYWPHSVLLIMMTTFNFIVPSVYRFTFLKLNQIIQNREINLRRYVPAEN